MEVGQENEPGIQGREKMVGVGVADSGKSFRLRRRVYVRTGRVEVWGTLEERWKKFCMPETLCVKNEVKLGWGAGPDPAKHHGPY